MKQALARPFLPLLPILALLGTGWAHAQVYAGLSGGIALNVNCPALVDCNHTSTAVRFTTGYTVADNFSIEAGYTSFGKFRTVDGPTAVRLQPRAVQLGGALAVPIGPTWGMNIRLGMSRLSPRISSAAPTQVTARTETKAYAGLGVTYALSPTVKLELATEKTFGRVAGPKLELSQYTVGAIVSF